MYDVSRVFQEGTLVKQRSMNMDLNTLKRIRLMYPGFLATILLIVWLWENDISRIEDLMINSVTIKFEAIVPALFVLVGVVYYAFGVRGIIWKPAMKEVTDNINRKLLSIAGLEPSIPLSQSQKSSFEHCVFYHFIDKDESLTIKSANVKENGCILSCTVDTILLVTFYILILALIAVITQTKLSFSFWVAVLIDAISIPTFILLLRKHIALSNEQLGVIRTNYGEECKEKVLKITQSTK